MAGFDWGGTQFQALEITQPRSNLPTNHRMTRAYPGIPYSVRVACVGGVYPYLYTLSNAPAGMTIDSLTGVITWPNPTANASNIQVRVEDTKNNSVTQTWSITVTTSGFKFVDAVNGTAFASGGTGTISNPYRTLADLFLHSSSGDMAYLRAGNYNFSGIPSLGTVCDSGNMIGDEIDINPSNMACVWIAYPGDAAPSIHFGGVTCATGCIIGWIGETLWIEGMNCHHGFWKFFNGGGGSNGGGTFYRNEFHMWGAGASNSSFLMWNHSSAVYGVVIQNNYFHNEDNGGGGLGTLFYDNTRALVEGNTYTDFGVPMSPKASTERFTFRGNTLTRLHYGLSSNMNGGDPYQYTSGEFCFNNFNGPFTDPADIGAFELGPTWINPVGVIRIHRNTFRGIIGCAQFDTDDGPFTFHRNVIVNSDSATSPYTHFREISGFPSPDWSRVVDTQNLKGLPAANIIDSNGLLAGSYRTTYLYSYGWEVPSSGGNPPVFTSVASTTFTVGTAGTFTVTTSPVASTISRVGSLPFGVNFVDNLDGTATISGTPGAGQGGAYTLTLTATNAGGSSNQTFTLTVRQIPAITSASSTSMSVGVAASFTVTTSGYPAPSIARSGSLPAGVAFTDNGNGTGTLAGTPTAGGTFPLTFTPSNVAGTGSAQSFTLTVSGAPTITSASSATFTVGSAGTFTVVATGFPTPSISRGGVALPSGVTFVDNGNGTGTLSGTPAAGTGGAYAITFTATNSAGSTAPQAFTLTVRQVPAITSSSSTSFSVGSAGTFTVTTSGYPAATITRGGAALPSGVTFTNNGNGTGTLAGTPAVGTGGTYVITFTPSNAAGTGSTQTFTLTVGFGPTITSASNATFTVGTAGTFTVTTSGVPTPSISRGGATLPSGVTFTDNGNGTGTLSGTPATGTGGSYALTFTATNVNGSSSPQSFTLTVRQAPAITSPSSITFTVGMIGLFVVTTSGVPAPTIARAGTLPGGVTFTDNLDGTGTLAGTPTVGTAGTYALTFTPTNVVGSGSAQSFTLTVTDGPVITSPSTITFTAGSASSFTVTASGIPTPSISRGGASLPTGVTFVDNGDGTGTLSGTPGAATGGSYAITFTATNSVGSSSPQAFTLLVYQAPAITSASSVTFTVGTNGVFTVTTTGYPAPSIAAGGDTLPSGLTFVDNGNGTGTMERNPATGTGGVYDITFTATNAVGSTSPQTFTLTVEEAAAITSASSTTFTIGAAGSFTVTTRGYPVPTITRGGVALPAGVTFTDNLDGTGTLAGTPAPATNAVYAITFTATNSLGSTSPQAFSFTVAEVSSGLVSRFYPGNQPMAFRVFGPVPGTWDGSLDNSRPDFASHHSYMASPTKAAAGAKNTSSGTIFSVNQQGNYDTVIRQWNVGPLSAQTIAGTFDLCLNQRIRWVEPVLVTVDSHVRYKVHIAIMTGQTNTVRHVLLDNLVDSVDLSRDDVTELIGKWQSLASPAALSSGDAEEGDYIRIVVGYRIVSSPTPTPIYPSEPFDTDSYSTQIVMYSGFGATNASGTPLSDGVDGDTNTPGTTGLERAAWVEFSQLIDLLDEGLTPPANETCATAIEITEFPYRSDALDTRGSTNDEKDVWYTFVAPRTGPLLFLALGSTYACNFEVWETCGGPGSVSYSDTGMIRGGRSVSSLQINAEIGERYYVRIMNKGITSLNSAESGGLLQFTAFYRETPQEDDLYLPAGNLIAWRRNEDTGALWPVMFSFNADSSGSALTGVGIDYTGREVIDNYGAGSAHTGHRLLLGYHSYNLVSILDIETFQELDFIDSNLVPPLLYIHPAQMVITSAGHLYQAFFGNGYLHIEGESVPSTLNAVSDVASYSAIRSLEAIDGQGQPGSTLASLITPDLGSETPSPWAITFQESTGALFFTMGNIYRDNVGSQQIRKYLAGVTSIFATLPTTSSYLPGLRGLEILPDDSILVCNGDRAHRVNSEGAVTVNYVPTSRPEHFQVCADIKSTADGTKAWVISFDYAALALFDIDTGEELAVYDTWQRSADLVQMAIYRAEGVTIPPEEPPEEEEEECPADLLEPPPASPLEKFFKVHGVRERPAVSPIAVPASASDLSGMLGGAGLGDFVLAGIGESATNGVGCLPIVPRRESAMRRA